jgi:hypothetical protein
MKTTVDIPESLLAEAQKVARQQKTTLKVLIQEGLHQAIARRKEAKPFKLRDASFKGTGMQPGMECATWDEMLALIYEGRGG